MRTVSSLPIDAGGVAHAMVDAAPSAGQTRDAQMALERLVDLSLITALGNPASSEFTPRWTPKR